MSDRSREHGALLTLLLDEVVNEELPMESRRCSPLASLPQTFCHTLTSTISSPNQHIHQVNTTI